MPGQMVRKICRYTGYTLAGVLLILLLVAGGAAIWLWGWTWKDAPTFHESWTAAERSAITEFDTYLRKQYAADAEETLLTYARALQDIWGGEHRSSGVVEQLAAAYAARMVAAPVSGMLHRIAQSGDASSVDTISFQGVHGLTPAIVAAQTGHLKALEALVLHGDNPNAIAIYKPDDYTEPMEVETPMSPLLSGRFNNGRKLLWDTRRQTAECLLAHGAKLNTSRRINLLSCEIALMIAPPKSIAPWEWALNNGLPMTADGLGFLVGFAEGRPLLERVLREKQVDVNDVSGSLTVLQCLLIPLSRSYNENEWNDEGRVKVLEDYLDMLLAAGANPNLIPVAAEPQRPGESEEEYEERIDNSDALGDTPLDIATKALKRAELPAHRELCLRIIEKLKLAGAKTSDE